MKWTWQRDERGVKALKEGESKGVEERVPGRWSPAFRINTSTASLGVRQVASSPPLQPLSLLLQRYYYYILPISPSLYLVHSGSHLCFCLLHHPLAFSLIFFYFISFPFFMSFSWMSLWSHTLRYLSFHSLFALFSFFTDVLRNVC